MYSYVNSIVKDSKPKPTYEDLYDLVYNFKHKSHRCFTEAKSLKRRIDRKVEKSSVINNPLFYIPETSDCISGTEYHTQHDFRLVNIAFSQFQDIPKPIVKSIIASLISNGFYFIEDLPVMEMILDEDRISNIMDDIAEEDRTCIEVLIKNRLESDYHKKLRESILSAKLFHSFNLDKYSKKLSNEKMEKLIELKENFEKLSKFSFTLDKFSFADSENIEFGETNIIITLPDDLLDYIWDEYFSYRDCVARRPMYNTNNKDEKEYLDLMFLTIYKIYDL